MKRTFRIAVVGCGAVAERVHLPALARCPEITTTLLVDTSADRCRALADRFGVPHTSTSVRKVSAHADAAIVGVPHHLHAPIACELLAAGVHVLVEKPMTRTLAGCDSMIEAAAAAHAVLAVGLLRRASPALQWVKQALERHVIGRVDSFELREGAVYRWPVVSPSMFSPEAGGVLADAGAHALDLVLWWLGGWRSLSYRDDARGGVEADCLVELEMESGAKGRVELSRTRDLPNTCVIRGSAGTIEVGTKTDSTVLVRWPDGCVLAGRPFAPDQEPPASLADLFLPQLRRFVRAIGRGEPPLVSGAEGRRSVELIAACYDRRRDWVMPWEAAPSGVAAAP